GRGGGSCHLRGGGKVRLHLARGLLFQQGGKGARLAIQCLSRLVRGARTQRRSLGAHKKTFARKSSPFYYGPWGATDRRRAFYSVVVRKLAFGLPDPGSWAVGGTHGSWSCRQAGIGHRRVEGDWACAPPRGCGRRSKHRHLFTRPDGVGKRRRRAAAQA